MTNDRSPIYNNKIYILASFLNFIINDAAQIWSGRGSLQGEGVVRGGLWQSGGEGGWK